jgi:hypothetical protein
MARTKQRTNQPNTIAKRLAAAKTPKLKLQIILENIDNECYEHDIKRGLSQNVEDFRELCRTTHVNRKEEILSFIVRSFEKYVADPRCFDIVYNDAYPILRDKSVESLKNNPESNELQMFVKYCKANKERAIEEFKKIKLEDLQENRDTWFLFATLANTFGHSIARSWRSFYIINNAEYTRKYFSILTTSIHDRDTSVEQFHDLAAEAVKEYYAATGDIQQVITNFIVEDNVTEVHTIANTLALQTCNADQVEHYWIRLKHASTYDTVLAAAIRHLHSLYFTAHNPKALKIFRKILDEEEHQELVDIIQQIVDYEFEKAQEVDAKFLKATIPFFFKLRNEQLGQYLKTAFEEEFERFGHNCSKVDNMVIQVFKHNVAGAIFTEEYIFDTVLATLQEGMKSKESLASHVFESAIVYFNSSLHLRDRLMKEYKQCIQDIFDENLSLKLIELGYTEFITMDGIKNFNFNVDWMDNLHAIEIVLDFCITEGIQPEWIENIYTNDMEEIKNNPLLKRIWEKVSIINITLMYLNE